MAGSGHGAGAQAAAAGDRGAGLLAVVSWILSPTTWLALIHLLTGVITGVVAFVVVGGGIMIGLGTLPVFGVGVAWLVLSCWPSTSPLRPGRSPRGDGAGCGRRPPGRRCGKTSRMRWPGCR